MSRQPEFNPVKALTHFGADVAKGSCVAGCFGFQARFLQKAEISEPIDEPILPGPKWDPIAVRQTPTHATPIRQWIARVATIPVKVDFHIRNAGLKHGRVVIQRPESMATITCPSTRDERRWSPSEEWTGLPCAQMESGPGK